MGTIELKWIRFAGDWRQALVWRLREGNGWRERILCVLPAKEEVTA
jgi:hypothetical protein